MSSEKKAPAGPLPTGAPVSHNKGVPKAPQDNTTPDHNELRVVWKALSDRHWVLATEDGKAVAWIKHANKISYELMADGKSGNRSSLKRAKECVEFVTNHAAKARGIIVVYTDQKRCG